MSDTEYCPDQGATLELIAINGAPMLNGDGSPMTITLLGEDSDVAVASRHATTNRRIQQANRVPITSEGLDAQNAAYYAQLTTGWKIELGGEVAEFSKDAAKRLYLNPKMSFIRDQVKAFIEDRSNFLRVSQPA